VPPAGLPLPVGGAGRRCRAPARGRQRFTRPAPLPTIAPDAAGGVRGTRAPPTTATGRTPLVGLTRPTTAGATTGAAHLHATPLTTTRADGASIVLVSRPTTAPAVVAAAAAAAAAVTGQRAARSSRHGQRDCTCTCCCCRGRRQHQGGTVHRHLLSWHLWWCQLLLLLLLWHAAARSRTPAAATCRCGNSHAGTVAS
jgi:hypothetical protein